MSFCGAWLPTLLSHQGFSGQRGVPGGSPSHKGKALGADFKLVPWFSPVLHREGDSLVKDVSSAYLSCTQTWESHDGWLAHRSKVDRAPDGTPRSHGDSPDLTGHRAGLLVCHWASSPWLVYKVLTIGGGGEQPKASRLVTDIQCQPLSPSHGSLQDI